jgi:ABC-type antimicrobial peptide transport system permease subunit
LTTPRVAVVSQSFVERHWPGQNPLGRRVVLAFGDLTVVGVAGDVKVRGLERESEPQVYFSSAQVPDGGLIFYAPKDLVVRSTVPSASLVPQIRAAIAQIDPEVPVSDVRPLADIVAADTAARGVQARVLGAFAAMALMLAAVGLHSLLAFSVAARTREIGVRVALGATRAKILRLVLVRGFVLAAVGTAAGTIAAAWAAQALQALLFGVDPGDGRVYGVAIALCLLMTAGGSVVPAIRATRVDPLEAIRTE